MAKISVVIVNWNVTGSLERCLKSIHDTKYSELETIVVDNNSEIKPKSVTIQNLENLGFPKAVNQGLNSSTGEFIVLLNPDTRVPKDFFIKIVNFFNDYPDATIMGPRFENTDGSIQGSVFPEPSIINTFREFWLGQKDLTGKYSPDKICEVFAVSGGCMVIPRSTIEKIGFLTEEIFMYYEDMDYCRRVHKAGLKVYFNPDISIVHEHGQSSKQLPGEKYRNLIETLIYPLRKVFNIPNKSISSEHYRTEAGIWYNGWIKSVILALIIWTSERLGRSLKG